MLAATAKVGEMEGADVITTRSSFFTVAFSNYCKQTNKRVPLKASGSSADPLSCTYILPSSCDERIDYSSSALDWIQESKTACAEVLYRNERVSTRNVSKERNLMNYLRINM